MEEKLKILILSPREKRGSEKLRKLGFHVVNIPVLRIKENPAGLRELEEVLKALNNSYLVFTSSIGVKVVMEKHGKTVSGLKALGKAKVACIGSATAAALLEYGVEPDLIPGKYNGEELGLHLCRKRVNHVVIARSKNGLKEIVNVLKKCRVEVVDLPVYKALPLPDNAVKAARLLMDNEIDACIVTSPLIAEILAKALHELGADESICNKLIAIGPTTAGKLRRLAGCYVAYPENYTLHDAVLFLAKLKRGERIEA